MQLSVHMQRLACYPLQLICFVLLRCKTRQVGYFSYLKIHGKYYITKQDEAKLLFRDHL